MTLAHHATRAGNATASYFGWWSRFGLLGVAIGIALAGFVLWTIAGFVGAIVGALLALFAGLIAARFRWPKVKTRHYFTSAKVTLPLALVLLGLSGQYLIADLFTGSPAFLPALCWGAALAATASLLIALFEEKTMKTIFQLVPADQQAELAEFLDGKDPAAGFGGQTADLSGFNPQAVAAAIKERVVGQDAIVDEVVKTTFRRAELIRPAKPLATFLFVGPTGCGKSELCKALARVLFEDRVFNMPFHQMKKAEDIWSIVGPPRGYQDAEQGGNLCREIAKLGTGVLALDEIEKAHPDVVDSIMRLLDEGQITEQSSGQVYSARGFVIAATSNAAAEEIGEIAQVEQDPDTRAAKVRAALQRTGLFKREHLSRFDAIFPFPPLDRKAVGQIVCLMAERHAQAAGVELASVDGAILRDLILRQEKGADAGMRNLDRAVERAVLDGLLEVKKAGYRTAEIRVIDGRVVVRPPTASTTATAIAARSA